MTTMNKEKRHLLKNMAFKCTYNDGGVEENGIGCFLQARFAEKCKTFL